MGTRVCSVLVTGENVSWATLAKSSYSKSKIDTEMTRPDTIVIANLPLEHNVMMARFQLLNVLGQQEVDIEVPITIQHTRQGVDDMPVWEVLLLAVTEAFALSHPKGDQEVATKLQSQLQKLEDLLETRKAPKALNVCARLCARWVLTGSEEKVREDVLLQMVSDPVDWTNNKVSEDDSKVVEAGIAESSQPDWLGYYKLQIKESTDESAKRQAKALPPHVPFQQLFLKHRESNVKLSVLEYLSASFPALFLIVLCQLHKEHFENATISDKVLAGLDQVGNNDILEISLAHLETAGDCFVSPYLIAHAFAGEAKSRPAKIMAGIGGATSGILFYPVIVPTGLLILACATVIAPFEALGKGIYHFAKGISDKVWRATFPGYESRVLGWVKLLTKERDSLSLRKAETTLLNKVKDLGGVYSLRKKWSDVFNENDYPGETFSIIRHPNLPINWVCNFFDFVQIISTLRCTMHQDYWLAMVGHQDAGKTSACENLGLVLPEGRESSASVNTDDIYIERLQRWENSATSRIFVVDTPALNDKNYLRCTLTEIVLRASNAGIFILKAENINAEISAAKAFVVKAGFNLCLVMNQVDDLWQRIGRMRVLNKVSDVPTSESELFADEEEGTLETFSVDMDVIEKEFCLRLKELEDQVIRTEPRLRDQIYAGCFNPSHATIPRTLWSKFDLQLQSSKDDHIKLCDWKQGHLAPVGYKGSILLCRGLSALAYHMLANAGVPEEELKKAFMDGEKDRLDLLKLWHCKIKSFNKL